MELGIVIEGEKVNLLPILVDIINTLPGGDLMKFKFTNNSGNEHSGNEHPGKEQKEYISIHLPSGQRGKIPLEKIQYILSIFSELHDPNSLNSDGRLAISRFHASQFLEFENAMKAERMRWLGAEKLLHLSQKLANFQGIQAVTLPDLFKGQLRDYQKQGLEWLNFLREFRLGGILADDMGLGKTVQTLAYLAVEKDAGRLKKPCLILAPTSVLQNWRKESEQFTPTFKVLVLQGQHRKSDFDKIKSYDIILSSYPLLTRDQEIFLDQEYSCIILDEAQTVKNANTKTYQVLRQLKSEHRLCLTGTPMENHLGELWALFNFLSPGFLGYSKQFARVFRTPIERQRDLERRTSLQQRIKPYLLRRTKDQVMKELPPKTIIIQKISLETDEQELYESIRMAMESKVQLALQQKGLAQSQIIILDALLKLRQVCCNSRLLSLDAAKKVKGSAKLSFLIDMLQELIENGRKILLFSSFTSMLALIELKLQSHGIDYVKLTGDTLDRQTPIEKFQSGKVPVFLISLKAGGTGLNLTAADVVIHYDPWWNPAAENQATDRAHRIGQTKPVFVYKLVTTGTIEEKILELQNRKQGLLSGLLEAGTLFESNKVTAEDLQYLFQPIDQEIKKTKD